MATRLRRHVEEEESYFISMTDLMVGLLFIFIIMLMFFALQYREAERQRKDVTEHLVNSEQVRDEILEDLQHRLRDRGINVQIVKDQGVLRLPEAILFDKGKADVNQRGGEAIAAVADALTAVLPCYTVGGSTYESCPPQRATIESIYIEGHTDVDRLSPRAGMKDNIDLSAIRATNTFRLLIEKNQRLLQFENKSFFPVLSVSGYGEYRPVQADQSTEAQKSANRRIDLRILMTTPRSEDAQRFEADLQGTLR
jgi:flagellar motor protein MotB